MSRVIPSVAAGVHHPGKAAFDESAARPHYETGGVRVTADRLDREVEGSALGAPVKLERFVARLLAKGPDQRPASAGKVRDVFTEIKDRHFGATPPSRGKDVATEVLHRPSAPRRAGRLGTWSHTVPL